MQQKQRKGPLVAVSASIRQRVGKPRACGFLFQKRVAESCAETERVAVLWPARFRVAVPDWLWLANPRSFAKPKLSKERGSRAPKFRMKFKNWKIRGYFRDPRCLAWRLSSLSRHSQLDTCLHCKLYSQLSLHEHFGMALSEVPAPSRTLRLVTLTHSLLLFGAASSDRCTIEHQCSQEETLVERGSYIGNMMGNYART